MTRLVTGTLPRSVVVPALLLGYTVPSTETRVELVPGITCGTPLIDFALYQGYLDKTRPDLQQPPPTALYRSPLTIRYSPLATTSTYDYHHAILTS